MKRHFIITVFLSLVTIAAQAQSLRVATFNLRFDNKNDSGNLWIDRMKPVANLIRFHDFDIVGVQEALVNQLNDVSNALPEYALYGKGRDDGKTGGEHSSIFFKKDKYTLLNKGDFWLSETPNVPGKGWDVTCCNRITSWVYLQDKKSGKKFYVFNTHYDHQGQIARRESSKLILSKIKAIAGKDPAILTGDFNADRNSEPYQLLKNSALLHDSYHDVKYPYENNSSFNNFGRSIKQEGVIDHIFLTNQLKAFKWGILTDTYMGKYPSDHFPVMADVKWK